MIVVRAFYGELVGGWMADGDGACGWSTSWVTECACDGLSGPSAIDITEQRKTLRYLFLYGLRRVHISFFRGPSSEAASERKHLLPALLHQKASSHHLRRLAVPVNYVSILSQLCLKASTRSF